MTEKVKRCPICGKPEAREYRPFCSRRCAEVDLAHWLGGRYRIPGREEEKETPPENGGEDRESNKES